MVANFPTFQISGMSLFTIGLCAGCGAVAVFLESEHSVETEVDDLCAVWGWYVSVCVLVVKILKDMLLTVQCLCL